MAEVQQQRLHELLVQQMTRAVPVAVRVARHPLPERHGALHVGRLVLNVSKYLIRLPNTRGKNHQRVRAREVSQGSLVVPTIGRSADATRRRWQMGATAPENLWGSTLPRAGVCQCDTLMRLSRRDPF